MRSPFMLLLHLVQLLRLADACSVSAAKAASVSESLAIASHRALPAAVSQVLAVTV